VLEGLEVSIKLYRRPSTNKCSYLRWILSVSRDDLHKPNKTFYLHERFWCFLGHLVHLLWPCSLLIRLQLLRLRGVAEELPITRARGDELMLEKVCVLVASGAQYCTSFHNLLDGLPSWKTKKIHSRGSHGVDLSDRSSFVCDPGPGPVQDSDNNALDLKQRDEH